MAGILSGASHCMVTAAFFGGSFLAVIASVTLFARRTTRTDSSSNPYQAQWVKTSPESLFHSFQIATLSKKFME
jgi:hypothetical protein